MCGLFFRDISFYLVGIIMTDHEQWAANEKFEWHAKKVLCSLQKVIAIAVNNNNQTALTAIQAIVGGMLKTASDCIRDGNRLGVADDDLDTTKMQ